MEIETLRRLQYVETEILATFDSYCCTNDINYSLAYGTLLGAVRHNGPIPWDDDVDIVMDRWNYEKFIECFDNNPMEGYFLQKEGPSTEFHINHMKLRKNDTILASDEDFKSYKHNGIWIDIFVLDRLPKNKVVELYIKFWNILRLVFTRDYPYNRGNKLLYFISILLISLPRNIKREIRYISEKKLKKYRLYTGDYNLVCFASFELSKHTYPSYIIDEFKRIKYNQYELSATAWYDEYLKLTYGDYMKLPPEEERVCIHNPTHIKLE